MYVCIFLCLENEFIIFMLLYVAKSLNFSPLVFVTGFPKLPTILWISGFTILAFNFPESQT